MIENRIAILQQVARELVKGKGFSQLLAGLLSDRVAGRVEVDNMATFPHLAFITLWSSPQFAPEPR
jgi:hypothetical protein